MTLTERLDRVERILALIAAIYRTQTDAEYVAAMQRLEDAAKPPPPAP
jgi:hypothetical protein